LKEISAQVKTDLKKALVDIHPYERKFVDKNILSTDVININDFYSQLADDTFETLFVNNIVQSVGTTEMANAFILNTVYGQYLIIDNFSLSKGIKTYPLFQNYALVLMKYESFTNAYIIAKGNNIVFKLKFDKESK
jgi:hypothetical protein